MFKFITHRPFWVNLLAALALGFLLLFLFLQLLGRITQHGKYLTVPSVIGKKTTDAIKFLEDKGFEVEILDSIYTDTAKMGIVLKQLPDPKSTVKINRTVLLTVNRLTLPLVEVPSLQGKTLGFALEIMRRTHFKLGDTVFIPDYTTSVLEQHYKGNKIDAGTKLPWGSTLDLVVGKGLSQEQILVPKLVGLTYAEAQAILQENGLLLASTIPDPGSPPIKDTLNAFVTVQRPPYLNENKEPVYIRAGQIVDLWISAIMINLKDSANKK